MAGVGRRCFDAQSHGTHACERPRRRAANSAAAGDCDDDRYGAQPPGAARIIRVTNLPRRHGEHGGEERRLQIGNCKLKNRQRGALASAHFAICNSRFAFCNLRLTPCLRGEFCYCRDRSYQIIRQISPRSQYESLQKHAAPLENRRFLDSGRSRSRLAATYTELNPIHELCPRFPPLN